MHQATDVDSSQITLRLAVSRDASALMRLAALDSAAVPPGPVLLAEAGGVSVAALPLDGGRSIADPFQHTSALVQMLELRAAQLRAHDAPRAAPHLAGRVRTAARALPLRSH